MRLEVSNFSENKDLPLKGSDTCSSGPCALYRSSQIATETEDRKTRIHELTKTITIQRAYFSQKIQPENTFCQTAGSGRRERALAIRDS